MNTSRSVATLCAVLACANLNAAESGSRDEAGQRSTDQGWRIGLDAGGVHRFNADLDDGGSFDRTTWIMRFSATRAWTPSLRAGLSLSYEHDRYGFDMAGEEPWGNIRTLGISLPVTYRPGGNWSVFALPRLRYSAETDADLGDGREAGLLAGASYRVNERLSIGPGLGVFSELGSGTDVFPILLVNWQMTDTLSLETGRGLAASRGPGLTLRWAPAGDWSFGLGARYEKRRFRLDDEDAAPGGIGMDKAVPVALTATWKPAPRVELNLLAGAELGGNLRVETDSGRRLVSEDYDTAAFAGAVLSMKF